MLKARLQKIELNLSVDTAGPGSPDVLVLWSPEKQVFAHGFALMSCLRPSHKSRISICRMLMAAVVKSFGS